MEKIKFLLITIAIIGYRNVKASTLCPTLPSIPGIVISCQVSNDNKTKTECLFPMPGVPRRTIAKYKCEDAVSFSENIMECRCRGKWKGMTDFQNYTALCGTSAAASNFSLDGPAELNMTASVIHNLANDSSNVTDYKEDALAYHNYYRNLHGASPLKLNTTLSEAAQKWAEHDVSSQSQLVEMEPPSKNRTYISNIYSLSGPRNFDVRKAAKLSIGRWYMSGRAYDFDIPVASAFTSMIWNATTDLGVGIASKGNQVVVVCNYWPAGNVYVVNLNGTDPGKFDPLALFRKNVFPVVNNATSTTSSSNLINE